MFSHTKNEQALLFVSRQKVSPKGQNATRLTPR